MKSLTPLGFESMDIRFIMAEAVTFLSSYLIRTTIERRVRNKVMASLVSLFNYIIQREVYRSFKDVN